jgi:hypothetical protein
MANVEFDFHHSQEIFLISPKHPEELWVYPIPCAMDTGFFYPRSEVAY